MRVSVFGVHVAPVMLSVTFSLFHAAAWRWRVVVPAGTVTFTAPAILLVPALTAVYVLPSIDTVEFVVLVPSAAESVMLLVYVVA